MIMSPGDIVFSSRPVMFFMRYSPVTQSPPNTAFFSISLSIVTTDPVIDETVVEGRNGFPWITSPADNEEDDENVNPDAYVLISAVAEDTQLGSGFIE